MSATEVVSKSISAIHALADAGPVPQACDNAKPILADLLVGVDAVRPPLALLSAPGAAEADYRANWSHQVWYHFTELARISEGRKVRAHAQGGDSWVNVPAPTPEAELAGQLRELAKLRGLMESMPKLTAAREKAVVFEDAALDRPGDWEHPPGLAVQRDPQMGACWQGQDPGGDWFWLARPLPLGAVSIRFDLHPVSTRKGGLIVGFCVRPLKPGTPLSVTSSPKMSDYFGNFDAYHFSVNRGSSGYCNLRRCGPGLVMLASFPDPCPRYGRWYAVEIVRAGPQVEIRVDGKLAVCYVDLGFIQPALEGGHFGLRHFQGFKSWHRNVRIAQLEAQRPQKDQR